MIKNIVENPPTIDLYSISSFILKVINVPNKSHLFKIVLHLWKKFPPIILYIIFLFFKFLLNCIIKNKKDIILYYKYFFFIFF